MISRAAGWRSLELGAVRELSVPGGRVRVYERGSGPPLVFAHGWFANANLWRKLVPVLCQRFRCLSLDLPFGAHALPMDADADFTPAGCARLLLAVLERLALREVTLLGNDSGGAYAQIATALDASRIARLVLNASETEFDPFPPLAFAPLQAAAVSGDLRNFIEPLRDPRVRLSAVAFGRLIKHPVPQEVLDTYCLPALDHQGVLRDVTAVIAAATPTPIQAAAATLASTFEGPVLMAWAEEDFFFPIAHARCFAERLRAGRLETIADSYSFTPEDQPERLAAAILRFADGPGRSPAASV